MSTTTSPVPRTADGRKLAIALGVVRGTVPAPKLPPMTAHIVPGSSPLEASGWSTEDETAPHAVRLHPRHPKHP
ncbi:hypothetical protein [Cellulomonas xiejunii]|uniref:Uncharacterized protein n=1 Tax=Cellulomonas xiejunii TaxID=2968083 RepID=A0ABY5KKH2_9CELL|nr:hypothetical protein [Cellulomonas xiejunii]MCC2315540.1 hypothetical protein [Cellulomonas xiejunii]MCC2320704.1 hypothetical protein [Cellulomonas xiejunii]UUI70992.1 hypothetical protein NP048_14500 [Cellulomonas xiejunii]